jgi:hypothetical protein
MTNNFRLQVERLLANVSMAAVKSWLKSKEQTFSAQSREQMATQVANKIEKSSITFGELEDAAIGMEEASGKLIFLLEWEEDVSASDINAALVRERMPNAPKRLVAATKPVSTKLSYAMFDGNALRVKWSETHKRPMMNLQTSKVEYEQLTKIIVLSADLSKKQAELRFDRPETVHGHSSLSVKNPKDLYFEFFIEKAAVLLGVKLKKSSLQKSLKTLVESTNPSLIRLHIDGHTNQRNNRYRVTARRDDIRDDEDWQAMHEESGGTWAHDKHSFYWRHAQSGGKLTREVFSCVDAINSTIRVEADCWDAEVEYAVGLLRKFQ